MVGGEIPGHPSAKLQDGRWRLFRLLRQRAIDRIHRELCDPALTYEQMMYWLDKMPILLVIDCQTWPTCPICNASA